MNDIQSVEYREEKLHIIDQTKLPFEESYIITDDLERISVAIERLEVRGAPAIGITAAYAIALSLKDVKKENYLQVFNASYNRLARTRPTAVNLFYALNEMKSVFDVHNKSERLFDLMIDRATSIHEHDKNLCEQIAINGFQIFKKKSRVLTHCNTGALATGGKGTALNVIRNAFNNGMIEFVYVDETRPLFQGSRLTAWELDKLGIPFSFNTDSTAAVLMHQNKVDLVITGADRIACNGDTANKIGTYNLAVLCKHHNIPFYIAAPTTTVDKNCATGNEIEIEERDKKELSKIGSMSITKEDFPTFTPAFDITPNFLITSIITEKGVYKPPFNFSDV